MRAYNAGFSRTASAWAASWGASSSSSAVPNSVESEELNEKNTVTTRVSI
jgi:hypothetical protein